MRAPTIASAAPAAAVMRLLAVALALGACSATGDGARAGTDTDRAEAARGVAIRDDRRGRPIDQRVFGTNLPAWLGPDGLADPALRAAAAEAGVTVVRMPGGSWSNSYDWLGCERRDASRCAWTWAARPSDFADFLADTGLAGMWTVSINDTAQQSAAAVAFFNGAVDDERRIGVDRNGVDWGTVGTWARLRREHGHPEPVDIELWEVGNEVYGGTPESGGPGCAGFGWEDVWTCDGAEYVRGDSGHDGYLAIRSAMQSVDATIEVGAVGVADPASWSEWGSEVIEASGADLDFYSVHHYGFDRSPDVGDALREPSSVWPDRLSAVRRALPPSVPIAVTEYNLVSGLAGDTHGSMTRAVNALYIADTIGQLVVGGVGIANQWNLANGSNGVTDYGLLDAVDHSRYPQFHAMRLWGRAGEVLLEADGSPPDGVHLYPTRRRDGSLAIVATNLGESEASVDVRLGSGREWAATTVVTVRADDLDATDLVVGDPESVPSARVLALTLPAWSVSVVEVGA